MKLTQLSLTHVRSFANTQIITFQDGLNILVGPNGGGKSTILDVLTLMINRHFLPAWGILRDDPHQHPNGRFQKTHNNTDLNLLLVPRKGAPSDVRIRFQWQLNEDDIRNMKSAVDQKEKLKSLALEYSNGHGGLDCLETLDPDSFRPGEVLEYCFIGVDGLDPKCEQNALRFLAFLTIFQKLQILGEECNLFLSRPFAYFPPYRHHGGDPFECTLSSGSMFNHFQQYSTASSQQPMALYGLAAFHFANKRRLMDLGQSEVNSEQRFLDDPEVKQLTEIMKVVGLQWKLTLKDHAINRYEITLSRGSQTISLGSASSGEKEIINFIFGIFALGVRNGLIIVDEPELHLHPTWQRTLYRVFEKLHELTGNQFILGTHSPAFITPHSLDKVIRVFRSEGGSQAVSVNHAVAPRPSSKHAFHTINSHNNEKLFFADKVILVEGIEDRVIVERLISLAGSEQTIEVLEVHGKQSFPMYQSVLNSAKVPHFIIADLDYSCQLGKETLKDLITNDKIRSHLNATEQLRFKEFLEQKTLEGVFLLSKGDLEDYVPLNRKSLQLYVDLVNSDDFEEQMKTKPEHYQELQSICRTIIETSLPG